MSGRRRPKPPLYVEAADAFDDADGSQRVTGVRAVGTDGSRLTVMVDRRRVARVRAEDASRLGLAKGAAWTPELAAGTREAAAEHEAVRAGLRLLTSRARSTAQLQRALLERGHDETGVEKAIRRFGEQGFLDDSAFAETLLRSELSRRPAGKRLLEAKLRQAGVADQDAHPAIAAALGDRDADADAEAIARKAARSMSRLEPEVARRRLFGRLARRGFDPDTARRATERALGEAAAPD